MAFDFVDSDTGEVLSDHVPMLVQRPVPVAFEKGGFFTMAQGPLKVFEDHAQDLGVDGFRVLMNLLRKLDYQNHIAVSQAEIAREMNMHRQHVHRAIKRLITLGALVEGPKWGQNCTYSLNPAFGWKGKGSSHQKAVRTAEKAKAAGLSVVKGGQHQEAGGKTA
jgi:HTH domain.